MRVGVLALQGAFAAHVARVREIGHEPVEVRTTADLDGVAGLVLPGGESTVQIRLLERQPELAAALDALVRSGIPVLATCAGLILAAREVDEPQWSFGWVDVAVRRNGYGPQVHSAEAVADDGSTELILIRAPRITRVGANVEVELTLEGEPILVRRGAIWAATYHPELTSGEQLHARVFGSC